MPVFIASCVAATGMESVERIEADDIKTARELLEARGFREIVFELDAGRYGGAAMENLTPAEQREVMRAGRFSLALWARSWGTPLLLTGAWAGYAAASGPPYGKVAWGGFGLFAVTLAASVALGIPLHLYNALVVASQWHRWDRTLWLARVLAPFAAATGNRQLAIDVRYRTARALIGKGRHREGIDHVEAMRECASQLGRLADLMWASGLRTEALELKRRVAESSPDHADGWIDYAALLVEAHRASEAREALERARSLELTALARLFFRAVEGTIELEEGNGRDAVGHLAAALKGLAEHRENPIFGALGLRWTAYLALACAAAGHHTRARECLARCRAFLVATGEIELLDRARAIA